MPFTPGSFDDVSARAAREGRLLLLDFTASWCAPCKSMEATTWPDPRVKAWVERHALALRVDVDAEKEVATRFGVKAMPTMILLRGDDVLDRRHGLTSAADLVGWLDGVLAGRTWIDSLRAPDRANDVRAHHDLARVLRERGDLEGALEELLWVWRHALEHQPAYYGVKHSFLVEEMASLSATHPRAREQIGALRDAAQAAFSRASEPRGALREWASLARASGDVSALLAWFDGLDGKLPAGIGIEDIERAMDRALDTDTRRAALGRMFPPASEVIAAAGAIRERMRAMPDAPGQGWTFASMAADQYRFRLGAARELYEAAGRPDDVRAVDEAVAE